MDIIKNTSADTAVNTLVTALTNAPKPCVALVSGGSSAPVFTDAWLLLDPAIRQQIIVSQADERFGPVGNNDSNWRLLMNLGFIPRAQDIPVLTGLPDVAAQAADWGARLSGALNQAKSIVAVLGVGTDNHVAGIKPASPAATDTTQLTIGYAWTDYQRITIGPSLFQRIDAAIVFMYGQEKAAAVAALEAEADQVQCPSQLLKQCRQCAVYYVA